MAHPSLPDPIRWPRSGLGTWIFAVLEQFNGRNSRCDFHESALGRQHSVIDDRLREAKLQRRLYGDELGEGNFASRPSVASRAVRGSTAGIRAERSQEVGADGPLFGRSCGRQALHIETALG